MNKIHNERDAIWRIQYYLHFIRDRSHPELPPLTPDGIYGDETRLAVEEFQRLYGLDVSGVVDYETNEMIYAIYLENAEEGVLTADFMQGLPASFGSSGITVAVLNSMLFELRKIYPDLPRVKMSNYFGYDTKSAVLALEEIFGFKESGTVDIKMYRRLVREAREIQKI